MDIETIKLNNNLIPYFLCWYDGTIKKSYFITDFHNNFDLLLLNVMNDLSIKKYDNYKIYFHNYSEFDGIFYLKN